MVATRSEFLKQLEDIDEALGRFAAKTAEDVRALAQALSGDKQAIESVLAGDQPARRQRALIEDICFDIMLLQQPLIGVDLRFVSGSFRMVSDLSHIDSMTRDAVFLAEDIPAKAAKKLEKEFTTLSAYAANMVDKAVDAFCTSDVEKAQQVMEADTAVNDLYAEAEEKLVGLIRDGKSSARYLPELLMVAKYFERMGDDAVRIADWAVFRATGAREMTKGE